MKAYVYLTPDKGLEIRLKEYIDNNDPGFFGRNKHWVSALWEFDTEDPWSVRAVLEAFSRHRVEEVTVKTFLKGAGIKLEDYFKKKSNPTNENRIFPGQTPS